MRISGFVTMTAFVYIQINKRRESKSKWDVAKFGFGCSIIPHEKLEFVKEVNTREIRALYQ